MDKNKRTEIINDVLEVLSKTTKELEKSLITTNNAINDAPGAMESHSDTTRSQLTAVVNAGNKSFKEKLNELELLKNFSKTDLTAVVFNKVKFGSIVLVEKDGVVGDYIFLPGGSGIKVKFEDKLITCITPTSPFGKSILGKEKGENFNLAIGNLVKVCKVKDLF